MKIFLLDRGRHKEGQSMPYLGFGYLAAALEAAGHEVLYRDVNAPGGNGGAIGIDGDCEMVCISASTFSFLEALDNARTVRQESPDSLIALGGPHTTIEPEKILENPEFDVLVIGEGEEAIVELASAIEAEDGFGGHMVEKINGIACRHEGAFRRAPIRPWNEDLDSLSFPAFHLFPMEIYHHYPVITSRGCPYDCVFCPSKLIWGRTWRARSPGNIVREIEHALERYDWKDKFFAFLDDTFTLDKARAEAICDGILEADLGIRWINLGIRADRVTSTLAAKMKRAGCEFVGLGIESANPEVLKNIKKGETLEEITEGIRILQKVGLPVFGYFMIGNPGDTPETIRETMAYVKRMGIVGTAFSSAIPYPGTRLWKFVEEEGRFLMRDYYRFHNFKNKPVFETPAFSARQRRAAYRKTRLLTARLQLKEAFKASSRAFFDTLSTDPLSIPGKTVHALKRFAVELRK